MPRHALDTEVIKLSGNQVKTGELRFKGYPFSDPRAWAAVPPAATTTLTQAGYASLAAAQAAFPTISISGSGGSAWAPAMALTDTVQWAAIQSAINEQTGRNVQNVGITSGSTAVTFTAPDTPVSTEAGALVHGVGIAPGTTLVSVAGDLLSGVLSLPATANGPTTLTLTRHPLRDYPGDGVGPNDAQYQQGVRFAQGSVRLLGLTDARVSRPIVIRSVSGMVVEGATPDGVKLRPTAAMPQVVDMDGVEAFEIRNMWVEGITGTNVDAGFHLHWSQPGHVDPALPNLRPARTTSNTTMYRVKAGGELGVGIGVALDVTGDALGQVDFGDMYKVVAKGQPPGPHDTPVSLPSTAITAGSKDITAAGLLSTHKGRRITGLGIPLYTFLDVAANGSATMSKAATGRTIGLVSTDSSGAAGSAGRRTLTADPATNSPRFSSTDVGAEISHPGTAAGTIITAVAGGGASATVDRDTTSTATGTVTVTKVTASLLAKLRAGIQIGDGTYGNPKAYNLWQPSVVRYREGISAQAVQMNVFGAQMGTNAYDFVFKPPASPNIVCGSRSEESDGMLLVNGNTSFNTVTMFEMQHTAPNYDSTGAAHYMVDWIQSGALTMWGLDLNRYTTSGLVEPYADVTSADLVTEPPTAGTVDAQPAAGSPPWPQIRFRTPSAANPASLLAANNATPRKLREAYVFNTGTVAMVFNQVQINQGKQPIRVDPMTLWIDATMRFHLDHRGNVNIGDMAETLGGGIGVLAMRNASTVPASNPTNGAVLYAEGGTIKGRATDGTVTDVLHRRELYTWTTPASSTASWTVPAGAKLLRMKVQQGGAGGAGGAKAAAGAAAVGGGGGGGGSYSEVEYLAADLPAALKIEVGTGGAGGLGATADSTLGSNGSQATSTYVAPVGGTALNAYAVGSLSGAGAGAGTAGTAGAGVEAGTAGGAGAATGGSAGAGGYAGGGGGGGGVTTGNAATAGGNGGQAAARRLNTVPAGGAAGTSGTSAPSFGTGVTGQGAGGGGGSGTGSAGDGGAGMSGGGGGGGAGARNGDRTVADAVTDGTPTVTSATAAFVDLDVGSPVSGTNIPASTFVGVRNSATSIGLSSSATANVPVSATGSGSGGTLTITNTGGTGGKGGDGYVKIEVFF